MTPAEKYRYDPGTLETLEHLSVPFAVYQFLNKRVVTLALSDGFLRLFGYEDRAQAYYDMDHDMYGTAHPDDVKRTRIQTTSRGLPMKHTVSRRKAVGMRCCTGQN